MANDYATIVELKDMIGRTTDARPSDANLQLILDGAATAIDRFCRRPDGFVADVAASARVYCGSGSGVMRIDECASVTTVAVKDAITDTAYVDWESTDWTQASGDVMAPDFNRTPYTLLVVLPSGDYSRFLSGRGGYRPGFRPDPDTQRIPGLPTVQVTAKWGYATTVPTQIKLAAVMQATRWFKRLQSGMSDALASGELGAVLYTKQLDPDVAMILKDGRFIRQTVG